MSCSLNETSTLLAYCQTEVGKHKYKESDKILTIFTHFIIVCFYSEVEGKIRDSVKYKVTQGHTNDIANYFEKKIRKQHNNDIKDIIEAFKEKVVYEQFATECKKPLLNNNGGIIHQQPLTYFNECIEARHLIAHPKTGTVQKGWNDIQSIVIIGEYVLNKFAYFIK